MMKEEHIIQSFGCVIKMNKYTQTFSGEICVMIDDTDLIMLPYGVYTFVGNVLVGAYYFETEEEAQEKYERIVKKLKGEI